MLQVQTLTSHICELHAWQDFSEPSIDNSIKTTNINFIYLFINIILILYCVVYLLAGEHSRYKVWSGMRIQAHWRSVIHYSCMGGAN